MTTATPTTVHWMAILNTDGTDSTFCGKSRRGMPKALWSYGVHGVTCWKCISSLIDDYRAEGKIEQADAMVANIKRLRKETRETVVAVRTESARRQTKREQAFAADLAERKRLAAAYMAREKDVQREAGRKAAIARKEKAEAVAEAGEIVAKIVKPAKTSKPALTDEERKERQREAGRKAAETRRRNAELATA